MDIKPLAERPHVIPVLAEWFCAEWGRYYGQGGPGNAHQDLDARCSRGRLPFGMVALEQNQVLGVVALGLDSATGLTPSVIGLLVGPDHRGHGVATALIGASVDLARELEFDRLHVSTVQLGRLFIRLGWRPVRKVEFHDGESGTVYDFEL